MHNWNKVYSDGQWEYLLKNKQDVDNFTPLEFVEASDTLMDDFINVFGLSKQFKRLLKIRVKCVNLKQEYIRTSNRFLVNKIAVLEQEIQELNRLLYQGDKTDFDKQLVRIEKWYGMPIDLKVTTVKKFKSIEQEYVNANKQKPDSRRGGIR
jgi:hypothetical protein